MVVRYKKLLLISVASVAMSPGLALAAPATSKDAAATGAGSTKAGRAAAVEEAFTTDVAGTLARSGHSQSGLGIRP